MDTTSPDYVIVPATYLERQRARIAELEQLAHTDPLTGLGNRRDLERRTQHLAGAYALLAIDIDWFKRINDTYGHGYGDIILGAVGEVIRTEIRDSDHDAFRPGGEEFTVLLRGVTSVQAVFIAERIRLAVKTLTRTHYKTEITVSIGVAWTDGTSPIDTLAETADRRLYIAKQAGRDTVVNGR